MLFLDESCFSAEQTLTRQFERRIPELLGSDWFAIVGLSQTGQVRLEARKDISQVGDEHALSFVAENAGQLSHQDFAYHTYEYGGWNYVVFPIRSTEKGTLIFTLHGRRDGIFDERDILWYTIYAEAAYERVLLFNQYTQEVNYINSILDSTADIITVLDEAYNIISGNTGAADFWGQDCTFIEFVQKQVKGHKQLLKAIGEVKSSGNARQMNNVVVSTNGENRILNITISPLSNSKNVVSGVVLVWTDVTQQQMSDYEFEQLKHYGLLGEISLGLSHDIKNPLMNIFNCANLLKKDTALGEKSRDLVGLISSEVKRVDDILNQMLSFGNVTKPDNYTFLDINDVLLNCIQMVNRQKICRRIDVTYELDDNMPTVRAKNTDMQQIFLNILINSLQAITDDGIIRVTSRFDPERRQIEVDIADNGTGLADVNTEKLFSPYYTTKKNGSGLGLFMVKRGVEQYGGTVSLGPDKMLKTVCHIVIPVSSQSAWL